MLTPDVTGSAAPALGPSTTAVHAGEARQKPGFSITDPIFASSTYTFRDTQSIIDFIEEKQPREEYGRYGNPSERVVEDKLAAIEGGQSAGLYSSGMAALVGDCTSLPSNCWRVWEPRMPLYAMSKEDPDRCPRPFPLAGRSSKNPRLHTTRCK
jgi:hypothetical protein